MSKKVLLIKKGGKIVFIRLMRIDEEQSGMKTCLYDQVCIECVNMKNLIVHIEIELSFVLQLYGSFNLRGMYFLYVANNPSFLFFNYLCTLYHVMIFKKRYLWRFIRILYALFTHSKGFPKFSLFLFLFFFVFSYKNS